MKFVINVYGSPKDGDGPGTGTLYDRLQKSLEDRCPGDDLYFSFIDINGAVNLTDHDDNLMEQIDEGTLGCPLITVNDEIIADGVMSPGPVVRWFEQHT